jgi:hypothetical protein
LIDLPATGPGVSLAHVLLSNEISAHRARAQV